MLLRDNVGGSSRCRIVYLIGELHRGGQERQLYYLLSGMDRATYDPAVVVWNCDDDDFHVGRIRALGVPVHRIGGSTRLGKLTAFRRLVADLDPDVVHSYSFHTNVAASWATAGTRSIAVGSIRSDFVWAKHGSGRLLGRLSARWPAFHVCNSFAAAAEVRRSSSRFAPRRCEVVPNGIDLVRFHPRPLEMHGPPRILGLGYFRPVKRWDRLLQASRDLWLHHGCDHHVTICGGGVAHASLQRLALLLDIADRVTFLDHVDDFTGPLAASTFVVLTSELEGCPNAVMEAMACGRAVIATDVGDVRRLVDDGRTGFVVPSGDHDALVDRLATLARDRERCAAMGHAARRKAETELSLERLVSRTLNAYRDAGWKPPAPSPDVSRGPLIAPTTQP